MSCYGYGVIEVWWSSKPTAPTYLLTYLITYKRSTPTAKETQINPEILLYYKTGSSTPRPIRPIHNNPTLESIDTAAWPYEAIDKMKTRAKTI